MSDRIRQSGQVAWALTGLTVVLVILGYVAWYLRVIWPPLLLAGIIVFLLNPVVTFLSRHHIPRGAGTGLAYLGFLGVFVLAGFLIVPQARNQWDDLASEWESGLRDDVKDWVDDRADQSVDDDWPVQVPTFDELEDAVLGSSSEDEDLNDEQRAERFLGVVDLDGLEQAVAEGRAVEVDEQERPTTAERDARLLSVVDMERLEDALLGEAGVDELTAAERAERFAEVADIDEVEDALFALPSGEETLTDEQRIERLLEGTDVDELEAAVIAAEGDAEDTADTFLAQIDTARDIGMRVLNIGLIVLMAPIIAFYLLVDLPHIRRVIESLIPEDRQPEARLVGQRLAKTIGGYFRGQLLIASFVGILSGIGMAAIGLPFWIVVGAIAGITNMIPMIGPWIGAIPAVVIALTMEDVTTAIWAVVVLVVVQQIDNNWISPMILKRAVKLHPAVVMLALFAGGSLAGFVGLLLAVPTVAVLKVLIGHLWRTYVLGQPLEVEEQAWEAMDSQRGGVVADVDHRDEELERVAFPIDQDVAGGAAQGASQDDEPQDPGDSRGAPDDQQGTTQEDDQGATDDSSPDPEQQALH